MKKQILFLTFFVAAILAGMNSYGQVNYIEYPETPGTISPIDLLCGTAADELHPAPGQPYTYTITTTSADDDVRWFVVDNLELENPDYPTSGFGVDSIISVTEGILAAGSDYIDPGTGLGDFILRLGETNGYNEYDDVPVGDDADGISWTGADNDHAIDITWKSFDASSREVLLVAIATDDAGCTNNIIVYRIIPEFQFTLDIAAIDNGGDSIGAPSADVNATNCVSEIEFATYSPTAGNATPGGTLTVDYGENWMFFMVNAANFVDSWMPSFQISYTGGAANIPMIAEWAYASDNFANGGAANQTWYSIDLSTGLTTKPVVAGGLNGSYAEINAVGAGVAADGAGEMIIVRVQFDYGTTYENATNDIVLSFAVNGVMFDPNETSASDLADQFDTANTTLLDLGETGSGNVCAPVNFDDIMDYTITPRPEVNEVTPAATSFETKTGDNN